MRTFVTGSFALALCLLCATAGGADAPPDLRLQWSGGRDPVRGPAGKTTDLQYELRNVGGSAAFAVIVRARTTLGPVGSPVRVQPGPAAGETVARKLSFALANGMREVCVDVVLQHRGRGEPPEANLEDNRICRAITIEPRSESVEELR